MVVAAFGCGLLLDHVGTVVTVAAVPHVHEAGASVVQIAFAVVLAAIMVTAFAIFLMNLIIDILYAVLDPRIRY